MKKSCSRRCRYRYVELKIIERDLLCHRQRLWGIFFSSILWPILLSLKIMCTSYHKHTNVGPWLGWGCHSQLRLSLLGPASWKCGIEKSLTHLWSQAEVNAEEQPCSTKRREGWKFTRAEQKNQRNRKDRHVGRPGFMFSCWCRDIFLCFIFAFWDRILPCSFGWPVDHEFAT